MINQSTDSSQPPLLKLRPKNPIISPQIKFLATFVIVITAENKQENYNKE